MAACNNFAWRRELAGRYQKLISETAFGSGSPQRRERRDAQQPQDRASVLCTDHRRDRARINRGVCRMIASPRNGLGRRGGQLQTDQTYVPLASGVAMLWY